MAESPVSPPALCERFHALTDQVEAILAKSAPLREARDAAVNVFREADKLAVAEIQKAEAGLYEIRQEIGMINRALAGKTGERPGAESPQE